MKFSQCKSLSHNTGSFALLTAVLNSTVKHQKVLNSFINPSTSVFSNVSRSASLLILTEQLLWYTTHFDAYQTLHIQHRILIYWFILL